MVDVVAVTDYYDTLLMRNVFVGEELNVEQLRADILIKAGVCAVIKQKATRIKNEV